MSSLLSSLPSATMEVSIHYGVDHRRMVFSAAMPWNEVRSAILSCFLLSASSSDYRFSYRDDEGDLIAVEHESEYSIAKQSAIKAKNLLELQLVKVPQNGASSENDDFSGLEDNSDLEESYIGICFPADESVGKAEKNEDQSKVNNVNDDVSEKEEEDDKVDDALSALNEAEQPQKMPSPDAEAQASPPPSVNSIPTVADLCERIPVCSLLPATPPPTVVQNSVPSPSSKCEMKNSSGGPDADAAIGVMVTLLSNGDLEPRLWKHIALSVINYFLSRASPIEAELIRSCQSSLEERLNFAMTAVNPKGFLGRFLSRRLFPKQKGQKKAKISIKPKSKPAVDQQPPSPSPATTSSPSPSASSSSSSASSSSGRAVHVGVRCDECNIGPIIGARYHCITCDENDEIREKGGWDCCEECETKTKHCSSGHVLIKMKAPAKIVVEKEKPSQQFVASGQPVIYDAFAHFGDESQAVPVGVINGSSSIGEEKKDEKKSKKTKHQKAKKFVKYLLSQFADESFISSSETDNDDDKAQKRLTKKIEKQKQKAAKAAQKAEKLLLKKAKKGEKKSTVKTEKKEEELVEKKEEVNQNQMAIDERKAEEQEIEQEKKQPSSADSQERPAAAAPDVPLHEPIIKNESSSSSAISSPVPPVYEPPKPSLEQKSNIDLPVPLPVALPVAAPATCALPAIIPAPVFQPINLLPPNPFSFPSPSIPSPPPSSGPPEYADQLAQLTAMGFPKEPSLELLRYYGGDLRKALNRLL